MKVTPDGEQLAVARYSETLGDSSSTVELFAFDAETGIVSNPQVVDQGAGRYYGVEFSPSRNYLYATVRSPAQLLQFDLSATDIPASKQDDSPPRNPPLNLGSMQAAPDGKIYVARENAPALGYIAYPDSVGEKAGYATTACCWAAAAADWACPTSTRAPCCAWASGPRSQLAGRFLPGQLRRANPRSGVLLDLWRWHYLVRERPRPRLRHARRLHRHPAHHQ